MASNNGKLEKIVKNEMRQQGLEEPISITEMHAHHAELTTLEGLADLCPHLEILLIFDNDLTSLHPLLSLSKLTKVDARNNPRLNAESLTRHKKKLRKKGIQIIL